MRSALPSHSTLRFGCALPDPSLPFPAFDLRGWHGVRRLISASRIRPSPGCIGGCACMWPGTGGARRNEWVLRLL
jgi:hypothetical protein